MNIGKMKAAGFLGIISGLLLLLMGIRGFQNPASHTFWDVVYIVLGLADVLINISIAMDASKRRR